MSLFRRGGGARKSDPEPSYSKFAEEDLAPPSKSKSKAPTKQKKAAPSKKAPAFASKSAASAFPVQQKTKKEAPPKAVFVDDDDADDDVEAPMQAKVDFTEVDFAAVELAKSSAYQPRSTAANAKAIQDNIRFRQAYEAAIENGDPVQWGSCKLMLIGQGAAGKTSTVRSLLGLAPRKEWESTVGVDLTVTSADDWKERDRKETDFNLMLHKAAAQILKEQREKEKEKKAQRKSSKVTRGLRGMLSRRSMSGKGGADAQPLPEFTPDPEDDPEAVAAAYKEAARLVSEDEVVRSLNVKWASKLAEQDETPLRFSIWDYGGQDVFYALHHIFLTRYGLYVLVFDMRKVLDEDQRPEALQYLRFWLNSVKLHAPTAPVVMVGTYGDTVSEAAQHRRIEEALLRGLPGALLHQLVINAGARLSFFPMDNSSHSPTRGVELRQIIERRAAEESFVKQKVSLRWIKVLTELVEDDSLTHVPLPRVQALAASYGISRSETGRMLQFFNEIGALVHLDATESLRGVVVAQPQWLLDKLTRVIADEIHVQEMYYDPEMRKLGLAPDFSRLRSAGLASRRLLAYLWGDEQVDFLLDFMQATLLLSRWRFGDEQDQQDQQLFLVTSLLRDRADGGGGAVEARLSGSGLSPEASEELAERREDEEFFRGGLRCALDFSEFYLPDGVFQRLVPICAEHSARDADSRVPRLSKTRARMSFGWTEFLLEAQPRDDKIEIRFRSDAPRVGEAIKTIVSMFRELKDNVMANLKWRLVLYSPRDPALAANYDALVAARAARKPAFRGVNGERVDVGAFDAFFDDEGTVGSFTADEHNGALAATPAGEGTAELPGAPRLQQGLQFHCFLSHKQATGGDVAALLFEKLRRNGLKVWYDEQMGELTKAAMRRGIEEAQAFVLLLSKAVFDSEYVRFELATAMELRKPMVLVHESDPRRPGYADFEEYVETVPAEARKLFEKVESLPFQRRYYLEKAFLQELIARISKT